MAHTDCTKLGLGTGTGLGMMGFYVILSTVHTTLSRHPPWTETPPPEQTLPPGKQHPLGQTTPSPRRLLQRMVRITMECSLVSYCVSPVPCTGPVPVECSQGPNSNFFLILGRKRIWSGKHPESWINKYHCPW